MKAALVGGQRSEGGFGWIDQASEHARSYGFAVAGRPLQHQNRVRTLRSQGGQQPGLDAKPVGRRGRVEQFAKGL
jgi:hypothetical protein